jgi:hypothetical protein
VGPLPDHVDIQLEPHEKHVNDDTELSDDVQERRDRRWQDVRRNVRCDAAEEGRAEKNSRHDLADDGWLSDTAQRETEKATEDDDGGERQQDVKDGVRPSRRRRGGRDCGARCRRA